MTAISEHNEIPLRERLEALLAFRVIIVTVLLGSAVAVDARALSSLSNPKNLTLLSLIIGTYLLTILYALGLKHVRNLRILAYLQVGGDMLVTAVLVLATGGLDSLFLFIFYLNIINAAVVGGRKTALLTATGTAATFIFLSLVAWEVISVPGIEAVRVQRSLGELAYEVGINTVAAYLIAVLAGYLAQRLGEVTGELERQQSNVEELRALNTNILASLNSGLLTVDQSDHIIFFNRAAELITGCASDDVYGKKLGDVFPELASQLARVDQDLSGRQSSSETPGSLRDPRLESSYQRPDGKTVFLGFSVSVLRDSRDEAAGRIVIFQDLSEVKQLEREKKRSERLAAIGQLAAAIAHEIRNPLASISGSVEMLASMADLDEDDAALMTIIVREVERLDKLITNFLDYSRPRPLELSRTDLVALSRDVLDLFRNRADSGTLEVELVVDDDVDQAEVTLDREAFRQIIWNLLNNAREAIEEAPSSERAQLRLSVQRTPHSWLLAVEDSGPGVSDDVAERIFEPFFTTKETGTGLGLATIHRLVEQHNGTLRLRDAQKLEGARFEVELPETGVDRSEPSLSAQSPPPSTESHERSY